MKCIKKLTILIQQVKWIRVLYSDFAMFTRDQEWLISAENTFDYIEGFVIINRTGLLNNWRSSFDPQDPAQASQFKSDGRTLFCLELAKYFNPEETEMANQVKSSWKTISQFMLSITNQFYNLFSHCRKWRYCWVN